MKSARSSFGLDPRLPVSAPLHITTSLNPRVSNHAC